MVPALHDVLFGERFQRNLGLLAAALLFVATFVAYATGVFAVEGGVVLLPADATVVGVLIAAGVGYRDGGLLAAWATLFAAYFAFAAEWAFLGLSSHDVLGKLAFLFDPVSLAIYVAASLVFGTAAFAVGILARAGVERVREAGTNS